MSASRCLRCALDAARPAKRINLSIRSSVQSRAYAQPTDSSKHHGHDQIGSELKKVARTRSANPDTIENVQQPTKRPPPSIDTESEQIASQLKKATIGEDEPDRPTAPNVAAAFRTPYKHTPQHGIPVAQLQLRSYSVRNLEVMAEFALRVAYYLKLAATGPAPLPRRIERWTTIRSNFVHKKSQENFERITMKRLITVYDGHPDVVELWLACLRKWQFYGVGMKANVWSFEELDVAKNMDRQLDAIRKDLDAKLANFGWKDKSTKNKSIHEMLLRQGGRVQGAPLMSNRDEVANVKNVELFDHVTDDMQRRKL